MNLLFNYNKNKINYYIINNYFFYNYYFLIIINIKFINL